MPVHADEAQPGHRLDRPGHGRHPRRAGARRNRGAASSSPEVDIQERHPAEHRHCGTMRNMVGETERGGDPSVSILLPTLNERAFIRDVLDSLTGQDYPFVHEILVIDGGSSDGTTEVVRCIEDSKVRVVANPDVTAAAALNRGLSAATGDVIVRADAHALYDADYVKRCVEVLLETGASNVGGRMTAVGTTSMGRAVAAVTSSPFGIGPGRFHYSEGRHDVETVYLGCWWREFLESLGGWDADQLQWAAEDQELNFRIRSGGGRVVLDSSIQSYYFPRETARGLGRQYFNYGIAKASTLAKHRRMPYLRPLAPAGLVGSSAAMAVVGKGGWRISPILVHLVFCVALAKRLGRQQGVRPWEALAVTLTCHWGHGLGFWAGLFRIASGRGFESRPSGHR